MAEYAGLLAAGTRQSFTLPFIEQNGNRIFFARLDVGSGAGTPVVLHHGMAQWGDDWVKAGWLEAFGDRPVFAIDALGHGRSDRPHDRGAYSVERRAEAVMQVADHEGLEHFAFFGFSMGGRIGFELALNEPSRIERLVIGGMHGLKPSIDQRNLERRVAVLRSSKWRTVERAVGAVAGDGRDNDPEALAISTEAVLDWNGAEARLPSLNVPTLMFCGSEDSLLEYAKSTADMVPGCEFVVLPHTNHAASFYRSDQARAAVKKFMAGV